MSRPDIKQHVLTQGAESRTSSAQEFAEHIRSQTEFFAKIVRDAGIKPE